MRTRHERTLLATCGSPPLRGHTRDTCGWCFVVLPGQADRLATAFCIPVGGTTRTGWHPRWHDSLGCRAKRIGIAKILPVPGNRRPAARTLRYFFAGAAGEAILASRRKRADSSGGVGLM